MSEFEEMRNRAIDAQEIMKPIADTVDWFIDGAGGIGAIHEQALKTVDRFAVIGYVLARDVKRLVEQLEAAQRWIPVEERLPDDDGHYIVAVGEHVSRSPIDWTDRDVYECVYSGVGWHTANDVTHWLPLPQPPGGER